MPRKRKEAVKKTENREFRRQSDLYGDEEEEEEILENFGGNGIEVVTIAEQAAVKIEEQKSNLFDKGRTTTRIEALTIIIDCLRKANVHDFLLTQKEDFVRVMKLGINSSDPQEAILNCQLLSMACVTASVEWQNLFQVFYPILRRIISVGEDFSVRAACVESLGICCFVWAEEEEQTIQVLKEFSSDLINEDNNPINKSSYPFYTALLDMWSLLTTVMSDDYVVDELIPSDVGTIVSFLEMDDMELRLAAGEALAYLCTVVYRKEEENDNEYSPYFFNGYFDVDDIMGSLQTGKTNQKKINKKDQQKQRRGFREILGALEEAVSPVEKVTLNRQQFEFYNWRQIKLLNTFRSVLGTGFQTHMTYNNLLAQIFDLEVQIDTPQLSKSDKRQFMSANSSASKFRDLRRNAQRKAKFKRGEEDDD